MKWSAFIPAYVLLTFCGGCRAFALRLRDYWTDSMFWSYHGLRGVESSNGYRAEPRHLFITASGEGQCGSYADVNGVPIGGVPGPHSRGGSHTFRAHSDHVATFEHLSSRVPVHYRTLLGFSELQFHLNLKTNPSICQRFITWMCLQRKKMRTKGTTVKSKGSLKAPQLSSPPRHQNWLTESSDYSSSSFSSSLGFIQKNLRCSLALGIGIGDHLGCHLLEGAPNHNEYI